MNTVKKKTIFLIESFKAHITLGMRIMDGVLEVVVNGFFRDARRDWDHKNLPGG